MQKPMSMLMYTADVHDSAKPRTIRVRKHTYALSQNSYIRKDKCGLCKTGVYLCE
jgi:hypothetical protein